MTAPPIKHGTANAYNNLGCRCAKCRKAWSAYNARLTATPCAAGCGRTVQGRYREGTMCRDCRTLANRTAPHGTETVYTWGCRCDACRHAATDARRKRRHERGGNPATHNRSAYCNGCRCDICREAQRLYTAQRRQRPTGSVA